MTKKDNNFDDFMNSVKEEQSDIPIMKETKPVLTQYKSIRIHPKDHETLREIANFKNITVVDLVGEYAEKLRIENQPLLEQIEKLKKLKEWK